jgi:hypothetical protein
MNFACLLQSSLQLHTWRPAFPHYSSFTALLGTLACLFCTFYLDGLISLIVLVLALVLFLTIELRGDVTSFGHALKGLKYHVALSALYGLEESMTANAFLGAKSPFVLRRKRANSGGEGRPLPTAEEEGAPAIGQQQQQQQQQQHYWRPQILVYLHASESAPEAEVPRKRQLLSFVSQLKATRGLTVAGAVIIERNILEGMKQRSVAAAAVAAATGGGSSTSSLRRRFPSSGSSSGSDVSSILQQAEQQQHEQQHQQHQHQQQSLASLLGAEHEKTLGLKREMMSDLAREGILGFAEVGTSSLPLSLPLSSHFPTYSHHHRPYSLPPSFLPSLPPSLPRSDST